ncbi:terminase large subunit [Brochothrix phage BtpYZU04]
MKSRQLGLSEIGVAEMLWFADRYSANKVKCMYAFPRL